MQNNEWQNDTGKYIQFSLSHTTRKKIINIFPCVLPLADPWYVLIHSAWLIFLGTNHPI